MRVETKALLQAQDDLYMIQIKINNCVGEIETVYRLSASQSAMEASRRMILRTSEELKTTCFGIKKLATTAEFASEVYSKTEDRIENLDNNRFTFAKAFDPFFIKRISTALISPLQTRESKSAVKCGNILGFIIK